MASQIPTTCLERGASWGLESAGLHVRRFASSGRWVAMTIIDRDCTGYVRSRGSTRREPLPMAYVRVALGGRGVEDDSQTRDTLRAVRAVTWLTRQSTVDANPDKAMVTSGTDSVSQGPAALYAPPPPANRKLPRKLSSRFDLAPHIPPWSRQSRTEPSSIMSSQGPVSISSKEQFTGILKSSKIVVADCTDKTPLHATTALPLSF